MYRFTKYLQLENSAGFILFAAALLAIILSNSLHNSYATIVNTPWVHLTINNGLMPIFFLLVALEIKKEMLIGELATPKKFALPIIAALGGMLAPALIYCFFNLHYPAHLRGWAIPSATDIAFSLGVLSLLGSRIPASLKLFLMALAIFDDLGAIIIIAFFYTQHISGFFLLASLSCVFMLYLCNRFNLPLYAYFALAILLWLCLLYSGIHATLSGVILGFIIPASQISAVEKKLHPWVAFGILPLFALTNAGIYFYHLDREIIFNPLTLGIFLGLFIGKQAGVYLFSRAAVHFRLAHLPRGISWGHFYGVSLLSGIGFTMSLFIGNLAFKHPSYLAMTHLGVIAGSTLSALLGYVILILTTRSKNG